jgi:hypothetical protein
LCHRSNKASDDEEEETAIIIVICECFGHRLDLDAKSQCFSTHQYAQYFCPTITQFMITFTTTAFHWQESICSALSSQDCIGSYIALFIHTLAVAMQKA